MLASLSLRLPVALVGLALASAGVTGTIGWIGARDGLRHEALEQLRVAAADRRLSLDLVAERIGVDVAALAVDRTVASNLPDLDENLVPGKPDTEKTLAALRNGTAAERIANDGAKIGTVYGVRHSKVHPAAVALRETGKYADVLMLNAGGTVVYSVTKQEDFGTSAATGPLAATGLGRLYAELQKAPDDRTVFVDFDDYGPAGELSGFVGRPVLKKANVAMGEAQRNVRAGYVVLRLTPSLFDRVMADRRGLGETGQVFAVGADNRLRTDAPLADGVTAGKAVADFGLGSAVATDGALLFQRAGTDYMAATVPAEVFGRAWTLVAEKAVDEALAASDAITRTMALAAAVILVATVLLGMLFARSVTRPIKDLAGALRAIAGGKLDQAIHGAERRDEVGDIARAVDGIRRTVEADAVSRAAEAETQRREQDAARRRLTAELAAEFEAQVGGVASAVSRAAIDLEAAAGEMSDLARNSAAGSTAVAGASEAATGDVRSVAAASAQLLASLGHVDALIGRSGAIADEADGHAQSSGAIVASLAETAGRIGSVVDIIHSIAAQTNLLALNATIEAARAGESGRGFAVVAGEVKNLAGQTARATDEIATQIADMREATRRAVDAIERIRAVVGDIGGAIGTVAEAIKEQNGAATEITRAARNAAQGTDVVSTNIEEVRNAVTSTETAARRVVEQARRLGGEAESLQVGLKRFVGQLTAA